MSEEQVENYICLICSKGCACTKSFHDAIAKATRQGFDKAMKSVPNPNYSQAEVDKATLAQKEKDVEIARNTWENYPNGWKDEPHGLYEAIVKAIMKGG